VNLTQSTSLVKHTDKRRAGSVERAVAMGATAVAFHVNVGSKWTPRMLAKLSTIRDKCDRYGMPLIAFMYPRSEFPDGSDNNYLDLKQSDKAAYAKLVRHCVRIGADLGADAIKTQYTGDPESWATVIDSAMDVPVVIAGGPRTDVASFLTTVYDACSVGGAGLAGGRNVFNSGLVVPMIHAVKGIVHQGWTVEKALSTYPELLLPSAENSPAQTEIIEPRTNRRRRTVAAPVPTISTPPHDSEVVLSKVDAPERTTAARRPSQSLDLTYPQSGTLRSLFHTRPDCMFLFDADVDLGALQALHGPRVANDSSFLETVMRRSDAVMMSERQAGDSRSLALSVGAAVLVHADRTQPNTPLDSNLVRRVVQSGYSGVNVTLPPPLDDGVDILKQFIYHRQSYPVSPAVVADLSQFTGDDVVADVIQTVKASAGLGVDAFRMPPAFTPAEFKAVAAEARGVPLIMSTAGSPNVLDTITKSHTSACRGVTLSAADIVATEDPQSFFGSAALRAYGGVFQRERDPVTEFYRFIAQDDPYCNTVGNMADDHRAAVFDFFYTTMFPDQPASRIAGSERIGIGVNL
jgi:DhnA family fructose-bisphosphate aldolase class Ia